MRREQRVRLAVEWPAHQRERVLRLHGSPSFVATIGRAAASAHAAPAVLRRRSRAPHVTPTHNCHTAPLAMGRGVVSYEEVVVIKLGYALVARVMLCAVVLLAGLAAGRVVPAPTVAAAACQAFPETGKQVCEPFLGYWQSHGGLAQQGLPLSDAANETNTDNGQTYLTQYFERARFEYHPEIADPTYQVLLGLLGREQFTARYQVLLGLLGNEHLLAK